MRHVCTRAAQPAHEFQAVCSQNCAAHPCLHIPVLSSAKGLRTRHARHVRLSRRADNRHAGRRTTSSVPTCNPFCRPLWLTQPPARTFFRHGKPGCVSLETPRTGHARHVRLLQVGLELLHSTSQDNGKTVYLTQGNPKIPRTGHARHVRLLQVGLELGERLLVHRRAAPDHVGHHHDQAGARLPDRQDCADRRRNLRPCARQCTLACFWVWSWLPTCVGPICRKCPPVPGTLVHQRSYAWPRHASMCVSCFRHGIISAPYCT